MPLPLLDLRSLTYPDGKEMAVSGLPEVVHFCYCFFVAIKSLETSLHIVQIQLQ